MVQISCFQAYNRAGKYEQAIGDCETAIKVGTHTHITHAHTHHTHTHHAHTHTHTYTLIYSQLTNEQTTLFLYLLLQGNSSIASFILSRSDIDLLVSPHPSHPPFPLFSPLLSLPHPSLPPSLPPSLSPLPSPLTPSPLSPHPSSPHPHPSSPLPSPSLPLPPLTLTSSQFSPSLSPSLLSHPFPSPPLSLPLTSLSPSLSSHCRCCRC